jgi:drug/metabolite transporter (DMT)-like permease
MIYALPIITALIWAGSTVVNRMAVGAIDPAAISFYRWLLALIVLTPVLAPKAWSHRHAVRRHLPQLIVLGMLGMALYQSLAYYSARTVTATSMGLILGAMPLLTIIISIPLLRMRPTPMVALGALISFTGLAFLISAGHPASLLTHGVGAGELLMLGASLSYALYNVLLKRWAVPLPTWVALYIQVIVGVIVLLPLFLLAPNVALTAKNIPLVLYAGLLASAVAPGLWNRALPRLGAQRIAVFMNLVPLFTALLAVVMLGERLHAYHAVGGAMILFGIALAQGWIVRARPVAAAA